MYRPEANCGHSHVTLCVCFAGVGKSCLLLQFTDKRFQPVHDLTIGKALLTQPRILSLIKTAGMALISIGNRLLSISLKCFWTLKTQWNLFRIWS